MGYKFLYNRIVLKIVSSEAFDSIENYCYCKEELFVVNEGGKKTFFSTLTGKQWGKITFDQLVEFVETDFGHAALIKTGDKFGMVDTKKRLVNSRQIQPIKRILAQWPENNCRNGKTVWFNRNGKPIKVTNPQNEARSGRYGVIDVEPAKPDTEGKLELYIHNLGNNNWKLNLEIHSAGTTQVFQSYSLKGYTALEKITFNFNDYKQPAIIKAIIEGKAGLIGLKGQVLVPFIYDNIELLDFDHVWYLKTTLNNKVGLLKMNFVELKKPLFKQVLGVDYVTGLLVEMPNGQQGYMDEETGKIYIPGIVE